MENIGTYTIGPEIGKGSFATVYKCIDNKTHKAVAIKSVVRSKLKSKKLIENLEIEISILKSMKHPHIVGLLDYKQTSSHFHIVMDYCSMGDLSYFIRKRNQLIKTHPVISSLLERYPSPEGSHGLNETLVIHFLKQLSSALQFLRDKSLVHRDIKPQNLLLCPPMHSKQEFQDGNYVGLWELPVLKIADFGFARFLPSTSMAETLCGSPLYMAPEILRYEKYNAKADLWSVGAVLYEMTVGKPPFKAGNHIELLKNIERANDRIKFPSAAQVPEILKTLIRALLKYNPTERISFNEFFNDAMITSDLSGNDQPLETSSMDENLFISEYISPINPSQRSQYIQPIAAAISKASESITNPASDKKRVSSSSSFQRDEEIKQIINENSPGPEALSHSIQANNTARNDKLLTRRNNDDFILEKDYVVVEKRAIEVNAIADELAHAGSGAVAINPRKGGTATADHNKTRYRRASSNGSQRRPSFAERRISISISPLSKAIGLASNRLWGVSNVESSNISTGITASDDAELNLPTSTTVSNATFAVNASDRQKLSVDDEVLRRLESLATKAHAVNLFADVKFSQLIPSPPSSDGLDDDLLHQNDMLPPKIIKSISEEGVALYVKTLSLLAKGMAIASEWWYSQNEQGDSTEESIRKSCDLQTSVRINELVQWIREKFNESLEKAEFIKLRLEEANTTIFKEEEDQSMTPNCSTITNGNIAGSRVIAEKLIFDRALEMSRNAAVNELVKEDLKGCELAYSTAIWMLEALLDGEPGYNNTDDTEQKLDSEDKAMVEKFIVSIGNRLSVLKKKLDLI
ncbi:Serine/threonine-protein kinase ATG1 (Autophagy-related protein 1) [Scheffersomyces stipitis CBS 6054]|uniref:Serine/threonine-protein kinase ATG1 n=1 Tax=Scheffersomyces stipitis (strain ATCC 58785 / CBS 6054 / NBRC 10063 / NRRL Y-11545) TaxID=322104 RepID=A3GH58_PICST|nr:Serine/threonine-protein kinase ATG1 (Autophagy-related protein 1) [Scheffersomyces stipitis CBS 6054]EAZ62992.2 Serine/threonine-protein kinase ATG1 (Autophagy-related protein 1) [Scheffersomyces stipitis CBS 6054]